MEKLVFFLMGIGAIIIALVYLNVYQHCDGIVKDDAFGIPRCFAEGGHK